MVREIGRGEVLALVESGAALIEVLPEDGFRAEHLPTAMNIPLKEFRPDRLAALDRARPVIVYCNDTL